MDTSTSMTNLRDICRTDFQTIFPEASVSEAAQRMSETGEDMLLVATPAGIIGVVSDRDIVLRSVAHDLEARTTPVEGIMRIGIPSCADRATPRQVARLMSRKQIRQVALFDEGHTLLGFIRADDVLSLYAEAGPAAEAEDAPGR